LLLTNTVKAVVFSIIQNNQRMTLKHILLASLFVAVLVFGLPSLSSVAQADGYYPYGNCIPHITRSCISNIAYWYNSCGALTDIAQNCNLTNQLCSQGQCINKPVVYTPPKKTVPKPTTTVPQPQAPVHNLTVALFAEKTTTPMQWTKNIIATNGDVINFLITIKNNTYNPVKTATLKADISNYVTYTGNLKLDGVNTVGNIATGIDTGIISAHSARVLSFTGNVQNAPQVNQAIPVTAHIPHGTATDSDSFTMVVSANKASGTVANPTTTVTTTTTTQDSPFITFLKRWYLWIIVVIILIVLFIIIYRRLADPK